MKSKIYRESRLFVYKKNHNQLTITALRDLVHGFA